MSFQKIFVLGAGAIGSSYGAMLSRKNDVTLVGNKAHVDAIKSSGLIITNDLAGKFSVKAETAIEQIPSGSLILLTTKANDSTEAIIDVKHLLKKDTVILVLQNGLGIKDMIQATVRDEIEIVRGLVLIGAELLEPGKITLWNGETIIEGTRTGEKIAKLFQQSGLKTRVSNDITREEWSKFVVNCVINPLTAILRVRNWEISAESLKEIRHRVYEECVQVEKAEGISLEHGLERDIEAKIVNYQNYSSMCQDILKGKKTEIDFLNGKIVELGKKHRIKTPVNETLVALIKFLEAKNETRRA
jgi:2-dehydropantoate 2-reductase